MLSLVIRIQKKISSDLEMFTLKISSDLEMFTDRRHEKLARKTRQGKRHGCIF